MAAVVWRGNEMVVKSGFHRSYGVSAIRTSVADETEFFDVLDCASVLKSNVQQQDGKHNDGGFLFGGTSGSTSYSSSNVSNFHRWRLAVLLRFQRIPLKLTCSAHNQRNRLFAFIGAEKTDLMDVQTTYSLPRVTPSGPKLR